MTTIHERAELLVKFRDAAEEADLADKAYSAALKAAYGKAASQHRYYEHSDDGVVQAAKCAYRSAAMVLDQATNECIAAGVNPYNVGGAFVAECKAAGLNPFRPGSIAYAHCSDHAE